MMAALPKPGYEVVLWDGFSVGDRTGLREHILERPALRKLVRNPSLHFGDLYGEHPELERLYQLLESEFEVRERHSLRVEWYIVALIVFEILLTLYDMWRR